MFTFYQFAKETPGLLDDIAKKAGTKVVYLSQIAHGHRKAGWRLALRLENATEGAVTASELRPEIFGPPTKDDAAA